MLLKRWLFQATALLGAVLTPAWMTPQDKDKKGNDRPAQSPIPADLPRTETGGSWLGTLIEIDGKAHPELIPQHSAWSGTLESLEKARRNPALWSHIKEQLRLSPKDTAALEATLKRDVERFHALDKQLTEHAKRVHEKTNGEHFADAESFQLVLKGRQDVLDEVDHLMASLSPEAQLALHAYKDEYVNGLKVSIAEKAWDTYRLPR